MNNHWLESKRNKDSDNFGIAGNIKFIIDGKEMIAMNKDGLYIEGRLVKNDLKIYEAFKSFIGRSHE